MPISKWSMPECIEWDLEKHINDRIYPYFCKLWVSTPNNPFYTSKVFSKNGKAIGVQLSKDETKYLYFKVKRHAIGFSKVYGRLIPFGNGFAINEFHYKDKYLGNLVKRILSKYNSRINAILDPKHDSIWE